MIRLGIVALVLGIALAPTRAPVIAQTPPPEQTPPLIVLLASDQPAYEQGAVATFTLAVDNPSSAPVTLSFSSGQIYDIVAYSGETEVWRWSVGQAFPTVLYERTFPPGLALLGRESWDLRDQAGASLPSGTYRVVASLSTTQPWTGNAVEVKLSVP